MARKLIKRESSFRHDQDKTNWVHVAIVVCQNMLMWTTIYVVVSTAYLMGIGAVAQDVLPLAVLLLIASAITIMSLSLLSFAAWLHTKPTIEETLKKLSCTESWTKTSLRLAITAWMGACGLTITFTAAKHPFCSSSASENWPSINEGVICVIQRAGVAASLYAMILAGALFVLIVKVQDPFRCHMFGVVREQKLLSYTLPYTTKDNAMFSEMSFKCRSSSSLSSYTLVGSAKDSANSLYSLYPTRPEKAYGLGIYAPQNIQKSTTPSFLAPRPLLSTIRSNISIGSVPPPSPLSPLPAYFPEKYRKSSAVHKAVHPPRKAQPTSRREKKRSLRVVPPSPILSIADLATHNRSSESLSSAYSRSISGEKHHPLPALPTRSPARLQRSPLVAVQMAADPARLAVTTPLFRTCSDSSSGTTIDDAATLQAKLPVETKFGNDSSGPQAKQEPHNVTHSGLSYHHLYSPSNALVEFEKRRWTPGKRRSQPAVA